MSRRRSDATQLRYFRRALQNVRTCLLVQLDPAASAEFKESFARERIRNIDDLLKPRPAAGATRGEG
jgi:hypothetical protein